jgi:FkbM family methyltransferase
MANEDCSLEKESEELKPWGTFAPRGTQNLLLLIRRLGLARGRAKKLVKRAWLAQHAQTPVDIIYRGMKFRLHPWDNVNESKILFGSKLRDQPELDKVREFVGNGGVFLDIGANIGYYSLMAASYGAGRILAIEPNPIVRSRLNFNISANKLNERVLSLPVALGDKSATTTLFVADGDMGASKIGDLASAGTPIQVEMKPLALVLAEGKINHVDAMKIDVEGMEDAVLFPFYENSPRSLWPRLVIIEHTSQQHWKKDILGWMKQSGYQVIKQTRSNAVLRLN